MILRSEELFPDMVNGLTIEERLAHAQLMVTVASIDGELVQEELVMIESIMGKSCYIQKCGLM